MKLRARKDQEKGNLNGSKDQLLALLNYFWLLLKILVIFIVVFPFIDKLRHKNFLDKAVSLVNELDIGCKPCDNFTAYRKTESEKGSF